MKNYKYRYVIGIDPSGNFNEGKGTTGWCVLDRVEDEFIMCNSIQASKFKSQIDYWRAHTSLISHMRKLFALQGIVISIEDYILYGNKSRAQQNSTMETCQLLGVVKMHADTIKIPLYIRPAVQVKKRWADEILVNKGYLTKKREHHYLQLDDAQRITCDHERDSMRHALHCAYFELDKEE